MMQSKKNLDLYFNQLDATTYKFFYAQHFKIYIYIYIYIHTHTYAPLQ